MTDLIIKPELLKFQALYTLNIAPLITVKTLQLNLNFNIYKEPMKTLQST